MRVSGAILHKSAFAWFCWSHLAPLDCSWRQTATSFVPDEDQGYLLSQRAASQFRFAPAHHGRDVADRKILADTPGVQYTTSVVGFSLLSLVRSSYTAFASSVSKDWGDRKTRDEQFQAIKARLNRELSKLPEAVAFGFSPPAIPGVGTSGGLTFILEDRAGRDIAVPCRRT